MISSLALALCFGVGPPAAESPAAALARLRNEAYSTGIVEMKYGPRFADHARRHPNDPSAVEALLLAARFSSPTSDVHKQALARLETHYARSPIVVPLLRNLGLSNGDHEAAFLRQIGDTNPDKRIRALAWRAVINGRLLYVRIRESFLSDPKKVKSLKESSLKQAKEELAGWQKVISFARAKLKSPDLAGTLADVSVGAEAPPTVAVNLNGKKVSLADYKGKVVVLDFWHVGCVPCRQMIPGTNALIEELKSKLFVQVGVCTDRDPEALRAFLKKTKMPWQHWWLGNHRHILETWDVEAYPTVYVVDHEGVIRHHQVGFDGEKDKLHDIVRALVKKAESARKEK